MIITPNVHFSNIILDNNFKYSEMFEDNYYNNKNWWVIRDLFKQAYYLDKATRVYIYGGFQTQDKPEIRNVVKSKKRYKRINYDVKIILDTVWDFIITSRSN